jgi:preprotein translocase subunit SecA
VPEDYVLDEKRRSVALSDEGVEKVQKMLGIKNLYTPEYVRSVYHMDQALRAQTLFHRDKDYVVTNEGEVIIVDEHTGRLKQGNRYNEGLHQAIEAKERVAIQRESRTMATITFQNYFRMYEKLSGMTGTAVTEAEEFGKIYKLEVVVVPSHRPKNRLDKSDKIYKTQAGKFRAIAKEVKTLQQKGQPVLIGTVSVEKNEFLAMFLEQEGVKYEILNAKNHEREGEIIAQAGKPGAVTLATNMAGRGVDIILGGNPPVLEDGQKVRDLGGLYVLGTERHESRRIDNQLRGRAGRQGDPGETQFYLSTEDDLMRIFAGDRIKSVMQTLGVGDDMPIEQKTITRIIESAQRKVEGFHFDTRKHLLEYDDVLNRHREVIYGNRRTVLQNYEEEKKIISEGKNAQEERDETLRDMIFKMIEEEIEQVVSFHTNTEDISSWNMKEICQTLATILPLQEEEKTHLASFSIQTTDRLEIVVLRTKIIEYCKTIFEKRYEELLVKKTPQPELLLELEKQMLLRSIDNLWIDHLVAVDYLRTGIGLRGYGQRDPLVEYKKETYRMFNELLQSIQKEVVYSIFKVSIGIQMAPSIMEQQEKATFHGAEKTTITDSPAKSDKPQNSEGEEIGRNDFCFCGSGKKYKRCHGA